jgi:hypothetical protein
VLDDWHASTFSRSKEPRNNRLAMEGGSWGGLALGSFPSFPRISKGSKSEQPLWSKLETLGTIRQTVTVTVIWHRQALLEAFSKRCLKHSLSAVVVANALFLGRGTRGCSCCLMAWAPVYAVRAEPPSRRANGFPAIHLVEYPAAFGALDDVRCQTHQLVWLNLVTAERAGKREDEVGLSFEPRRHHPTRPSAVRTGFRIIRCESRPRNSSDGR